MKKVQFSGAKRPLYYIDNNYIFNSYEIIKKDISKMFLMSDGFVDQMGMNGKKYGSKRFKELITDNKELKLNDLEIKLNKELNDHMGDQEQRDDITLVCIENN